MKALFNMISVTLNGATQLVGHTAKSAGDVAAMASQATENALIETYGENAKERETLLKQLEDIDSIPKTKDGNVDTKALLAEARSF